MMQTVQQNAYDQDPYAKEFGIKISENLASVEARVLPAPWVEWSFSNCLSFPKTFLILFLDLHFMLVCSWSIMRLERKRIVCLRLDNGIWWTRYIVFLLYISSAFEKDNHLETGRSLMLRLHIGVYCMINTVEITENNASFIGIVDLKFYDSRVHRKWLMGWLFAGGHASTSQEASKKVLLVGSVMNWHKCVKYPEWWDFLLLFCGFRCMYHWWFVFSYCYLNS